MYHESTQGVDEHMINVHYYYYIPPPSPNKYVNKIKKQRELTITAHLLFVSHVHVH